MKIPACAAFLVLLGASSAQAQYASVVIHGEVKPGVYGRVEFGNAPPPVVVYPAAGRDRPAAAAASADLPSRTARPREEVGQALPQVQRMQSAGLFVKSHEYGPEWDDHHDHKKHNKGKGKG